jgi:hypothetical protein
MPAGNPLGYLLPLLNGTPEGGLPFDMPDVSEPSPVVNTAPKQGGFDLDEMMSRLLMAFSAGQAIRQRDPQAISDVIGTFARGLEDRRRTRMAEEGQRLREEREARLAKMSGLREERLTRVEEARGVREKAASDRQALMDQTNYSNTAEDNTRALLAGGGATNPAALEEYIHQRAAGIGPLGGDVQALKALLLSAATQAQQPEPEVPYIERAPGTEPPKTVPKGAVVRNAPQPRQPRAEPLPKLKWVPDDQNPGMEKEVLTDPRTGARIRDTGERRKATRRGGDEISRLLDELNIGGGAGATTTPAPAPSGRGAGSGRGAAPSKATGPAKGTRRTVNGQLAEWDGQGWVAVGR